MTTPEGDRHQRRAERLWQRMDEIFGVGRWRKLRGETPPGAWVAGLTGLTDEEVRAGIYAVMTDWPGTSDPPTWPQFRDLARPPDGRTPEQKARDARIRLEQPERQTALPSPERLAAGSETGRRWLACWVAEGLRPMPPGWSMDDVDRELGDADVTAMRAETARGTREILARFGRTT